MEVAASNTSERLHCSFRGFDRSGLGSSVGSSGSGSGGGSGFGAVVGACVRLPESEVTTRVNRTGSDLIPLRGQ